MDTKNIGMRVKEVISRDAGLGWSPERISDDAGLFTDLGLDSIQVLEVIVGLEGEFGITIGDDDIGPEMFESVASLVQFVAVRIGSSAAEDGQTESSSKPGSP